MGYDQSYYKDIFPRNFFDINIVSLCRVVVIWHSAL